MHCMMMRQSFFLLCWIIQAWMIVSFPVQKQTRISFVRSDQVSECWMMHQSSTGAPAANKKRNDVLDEEKGKENGKEIRSTGTIITTMANDANHISSVHIVNGITCREMPMELPIVGTVTVLEATAESQEDLVDMALIIDEDNHNNDINEAVVDETVELDLLNTTQMKLTAGDPYGAVLWPAAWAVAKYLLLLFQDTEQQKQKQQQQQQQQRPLEGLTILELGTGTGLVSIAAAIGGANSVIATDYEPIALQLTEYAATTFHPTINNVDSDNDSHNTTKFQTMILDMCKYKKDEHGSIYNNNNDDDDDLYQPLPKADIVVAADIMYEPRTGIAMAYRTIEALKQNSRVIIGDSPGRPGRPAFIKQLIESGIPSDHAKFTPTVGRTCTGPRHELICGKGSTSVSETPKDLEVAVMDLHPYMLTSK